MYSALRRRKLFWHPGWARNNGSLLFSSTAVANGTGLRYANDIDFRMGSGNFTIEWFQYMQSTSGAPRVFSIGTYPSASIGVSIEGALFYLWRGGINFTRFGATAITNKWVHFAIVGENNTTIKIYQDGVFKTEYTGTYDFSNTTDALMIGNESTRTTNAGFNGYITNFRWTKGTAVYTAPFTPPTAPLAPVSGTSLLLLANSDAPFNDSSGLSKTATNFGVVWNSLTPF